MASMYSGFSSRKMEDFYVQLLQKCLNMLSLKILFMQAGGDFLTEDLRE